MDQPLRKYLVPLSAKSEERLQLYVAKMLAFLHRPAGRPFGLEDLSYTMQVGRVAMGHRVAFLAHTLEELGEAMAAFAAGVPNNGRWLHGRLASVDETMEFLEDDQDTQELIQKWWGRGQLQKLAAAWVKGVPVCWHLLARRAGVRRVSLPTYPFDYRPIWLDDAGEQQEPEAGPIEVTAAAGQSSSGRNRADDGSSRAPFSNAQAQPSLMVPVWDACPGPAESCAPDTDACTLFVGGSDRDLEATRSVYQRVTALTGTGDVARERVFDSVGRSLQQIIIIPREVAVDTAMDSLIHEQQAAVVDMFELAKSLLDRGYGRESLCWTIITRNTYYVIPGDRVNPTHASIPGFIGVLAKEYPNWKFRLIDAESGDSLPLGSAFRVPFDANGNAWANRRGRWFRQHLMALDQPVPAHASLFERGGVYMLIGGAGGIGEVFSRWVMQEFAAKLLWVGRRERDAAIQAKIERLSRLGTPPLYFQADATSEASLQNALREAKKVYGKINGVVLSTIVLADASFANMTQSRFLASLRAKADVSVVAARILEREDLDFILFFSSLTAFIKGAGQSNYAAGCSFTDAFAQYLQQNRPCRVKVMNWGYWGNVGIVKDPGTQAYMRQAGMGSIEPEDGMAALSSLCRGPFEQLIYLKTLRQDALADVLGDYASTSERIECYRAAIPQQLLRGVADAVRLGQSESTAVIESATRYVGEVEDLLCRMLREYVTPFLAGRSHPHRKYDRWMHASLELLREKGLLDAAGVRVPDRDGGIERLWELWSAGKKRWQADESTRNQVRLAERCLRSLPEILLGHIAATSVIFPDSSMELVEPLYKRDSRFKALNRVLERVVERYIEERVRCGMDRDIRILEIGAGTGGTTSGLIGALRRYEENIEEYLYTDVSEAFLNHAKRHYGPLAPYLKTGVLNIEHPITEQEIQADRYDIVIAANVIHATRNIHRSIRHCKSALRNGGILLLNEIHAQSAYGHVTFGLLDGWWRYEDADLRIAGTPLLAPAAWLQVLREEGFESIFFPAEPLHDLGHHITVGASDGVVRLPARVRQSINAARAGTGSGANVVRAEPTKHVDRSDGRAGPAAIRLVEGMLVGALAKCLNRPEEKIEIDTPFSEYGLDSILSIGLLKRINAALGLTLSVAVLYEFPSVSKLAGHLSSVHGKATARLAEPTQSVGRSGEEPPSRESSRASAPLAEGPAGAESLFQGPTAGVQARCSDGIAIIGMAAQLPGADDVEAFWQNLVAGKDCVTVLPKDWRDPCDAGSSPGACQCGGLLEEKESFDPLFFKISPAEAESMSYHQRLILQESWKALEDAGHDPKSFADAPVGIFIGAEPAGYPAQSFTGGSDAIIASRLSYFLDLKGPALLLNTGCSSSAAAMHLACESLRSGESDMALAGGVFASMRPEILTSLSDLGIQSATGRCRPFDAACDGTIVSEGVGVVVLKRLQNAIIDGDHVYGVIVASGMNQDGASNGITAPNGGAQIRLISGIYDKFHINPEEITYVEAHGTGTKLGDPVEANALARAFGKYTDRKHYCGLGSVKANVGHTAAAAGVVGLVKILLAMKHRTLPGLLHFQRLNPLIELEGSPFYIQRELSEWQRKDGKPLMAALSSFGHSGTNVHMVIKEHLPHESPVVGSTDRATATVVPISARDRGSLVAAAERLARFIRARDADARIERTFTLANLAFTLQVGREAMQERAAFLVHDLDELVAALDSFVRGVMPRDSWCGSARKQESRVAVGAGQVTGSTPPEVSGLKTIAEEWVRGAPIEWGRMHDGAGRQRISLPAYAFRKERYSPPKTTSAVSSGRITAAHRAGSLLGENLSTLSRQRYCVAPSRSSSFARYVSEQDGKALSAIGYLEMARQALIDARRDEDGRITDLSLRNVAWSEHAWGRAVAELGDDLRMYVELFPEGRDVTKFEIYIDSDSDGVAGGESGGRVPRCILAQGDLVPDANAPNGPGVDIDEFKRGAEGRLTSEQCYRCFQEAGIEYPAAGKCLEEVCVGSGVLAKLRWPDNAFEDPHSLHPQMVDTAIHLLTTVCGEKNPSTRSRRWWPASIASVNFWDRTTGCVWLHAVRKPGADSNQFKLDITLLDEEGRAAAKLSEVVCAAVGNAERSDSGALLLFKKAWRAGYTAGARAAAADENLLVLCGMDPRFGDLARSMPGTKVVSLFSNACSLAEQYTDHGVQLLHTVRELLQSSKDVAIQFVVPSEAPSSLHAGLFAFLRSASLENPRVRARTLAVPRQWTGEKLLAVIVDTQAAVERHIRYVDEHSALVPYFQELAAGKQGPAPSPWKARGVYLITGGLGGLGLLVARDIAHGTSGARLILVGRRELGAGELAAVDELQRSGAHVLYRRANVADADEVQSIVDEVVRDYGCITGIVHTAGVIRDNYIIKKSQQELTDVFAPKVQGALNLDRATARVQLDFMILYSSAAGSLGSPGQADYSAANAFMDELAEYRNGLVRAGQRHGHTVAIDWGLWDAGGMPVDELALSTWREVAGMLPIDTERGLQGLYTVLQSGASQVMVVAGVASKIRHNVAIAERVLEPGTARGGKQPPDDPQFRTRCLNKLLELFGSLVKVPVARLDEDEPLENYGIDSIVVTKLNRALGTVFSSVSKTLFYEYPTLSGICAHLIEKHGEECRTWITRAEHSGQADLASQSAAGPVGSLFPVLSPHRARSSWQARVLAQAKPNAEPIAIIGITGRYPHAGTVEEFWRNLQAGRDCISTVPSVRWPLHDFYLAEVEGAVREGKSYSRCGGFLEGFADFDPAFFNMSPREARATDPQERLFLQASWSLLEDAGYSRRRLAQECKGEVGVFVGVTQTAFNLYGPALKDRREVVAHSSSSSIANRVSYFFNFNGPSIPIDTMCSSSLTALHLACDSLRNESCRMAIAGGVNIYTHPWTYVTLCALRMLSADGKCRSFGRGANGFVPGEGVGAFLLKPLSRAIEDNDNIRAVIRGSHVNHGGKTNGYTVPSPKAQSRVIRAALDRSGIDPRTVSYVEAHGTGTALGDPIEINGLTEAFRESTQASGFCALGSVKPNIGHLEAAAGIASATKVVLQLEHKMLVPSLNAEDLNPNIDFANSPFFVNRQLSRWEPSRGEERIARIAGVSSFGAGGANAHMLFEEYRRTEPAEDLPRTFPVVAFVLSAQNGERLVEYAKRLLNFAAGQRELAADSLVNLAFTFQIAREPLPERLAFTMSSVNDLERNLSAFVEERPMQGLHRSRGTPRAGSESSNDRLGELMRAIAERPATGEYEELLRLWVQGAEVNWEQLYGSQRPAVMSAPTYPFAAVAYWFDAQDGEARRDARRTPCTEAGAQFDVDYYSRLIDEALGAAGARELVGCGTFDRRP